MRRVYWMCCVLVVAEAAMVQGAAFFVAPEGDDANTGISAASPFQTLQLAIDVAAATAGPDTIHIAAGVYAENLEIDDPDKLTLAGKGSGVVLDGGGSDVITIKSGDVTISDLTITGGDDGIQTKGFEGSLTLRNVDISENADRGLDAKEIGSVTISGSMFSANGDDGIRVGDSDGEVFVHSVTIRHTVFLDNDGDGIDLEKIADIDVTDVTAEANGDEGLEVDDSGSVSVVGGFYANNDDEGIDVDDAQSIRVVSVVSMENGGSGFQHEAEGDFDTESVTIVNSVFSGNGVNGVEIVEDEAEVAQVRLTNVTAENNDGSGLYVVISGTAKVTNITSEGNRDDDVLPE